MGYDIFMAMLGLFIGVIIFGIPFFTIIAVKEWMESKGYIKPNPNRCRCCNHNYSIWANALLDHRGVCAICNVDITLGKITYNPSQQQGRGQ